MEADKFEKHIKEAFRNREIPPSEAAWQKLSEKLHTVSKTKKRGYLKYAIAASFIGLGVWCFLWLKPNNTFVPEPVKVVNTPKVDEHMQLGSEVNNRQLKQIKETKLVQSTVVDVKKTKTNKVERSSIKNEPVEIFKVKKVNAVHYKIKQSVRVADKVDKILDNKIHDVLAKVNALEAKNIDLTEAEVDVLLRKAQKEVLADKVFQESNKIDPMALLTEVEDELDKSLRDKLFDRLKTGFVKVRTAVAESNK